MHSNALTNTRTDTGRRRSLRALSIIGAALLGALVLPNLSQDSAEASIYNFIDDPAPKLELVENTSGDLVLLDGSPQGDDLSAAFSGGSVTVDLEVPSGWTLNSVTWSDGSAGVFSVPAPGTEDTYSFTYAVTNDTSSATGVGSGKFKVKKTSTSGG